MTMTVSQFLVVQPEFAGVDTTLLQAELDAAALEIDVIVWGPKADQGQRYLAAHKLALSPFGQGVRLVAKDGTTTYWTHYERLRKQVSSGSRVA